MSAQSRAPALTLRERKKARTREAIVTAALDLFERKGYDATTIEEIADAADVSPRTFFRYFDSKVDVIMDPTGDSGDLGEQLGARPPEEGPVEAIRQVLRTSMREYCADNPLFGRQMRIMLETPSLQGFAREHFNEHQSEMAREFAARLGVPEDDLRVHVIAGAVGNTIWTVVSRWAAEDAPPERLLDMLDQGCDLLASGLDAPPARARR